MQWTHLRGFSLIEILIVVVLLALIGALAVPSFNNLIERSRATALADQLQAHLSFARASSVTMHRNIEVCGSSNGIDCDHSWRHGWIVRQVSNAEVLQHHRLTLQDHLYWNRNKSIVFRGNGTSPASNGSFTICNGSSQTVWRLVLNNHGRVRREAGSKNGENDDGVCSG